MRRMKAVRWPRAASGALERIPLVRSANLVRALGELKERRFWVTGLDAGGAQDIAGASLGLPRVLVLGAEGRGLRRLVRETCDETVRIPVLTPELSLNVASAAAVALHEVWRRLPRAPGLPRPVPHIFDDGCNG